MKVLILLSFITLLVGCDDEKVKPSINTALKIAELPTQESWNSKVFFTDSGKTKAVLHAGHLRVFAGGSETLLDKNVKVEFFNDLETLTTTLTSKRGRVDDLTRNLYAIDSVVAVNDSGITLITDELMWRDEDRKITSNKFVTILTSIEKIEGFGFESDQSLDNYVIYNVTYVSKRDTL